MLTTLSKCCTLRLAAVPLGKECKTERMLKSGSSETGAEWTAGVTGVGQLGCLCFSSCRSWQQSDSSIDMCRNSDPRYLGHEVTCGSPHGWTNELWTTLNNTSLVPRPNFLQQRMDLHYEKTTGSRCYVIQCQIYTK